MTFATRDRYRHVVERVATDVNRAAPTEFARFVKVHGQKGRMEVGDEYLVRMPGPWDGPVRVVDRTPTSFRLATLDGHLEAGQIEFRVAAESAGLRFTIESWARSGDQLSRIMYQRLRMAKEVQLHMWTSFLERIAHVRIPIIAGIWPLVSARNAVFLANEVPGVVVPPEIIARMRAASDKSKEAAVAEGIAIAREMLERVRPSVQGVQVSAPFGNVKYALEVFEALPEFSVRG